MKSKWWLVGLMFVVILNLFLVGLTISWWSYKTDQLELVVQHVKQDGKYMPINFPYVERIDTYFTIILFAQLLFPPLTIFLLIDKYFRNIGGYKNYTKIFVCLLVLICMVLAASPSLKFLFLYLI